MSNHHSHRDNIIRQESAEVLLQDYLGLIESVILEGFDAWKDFASKMPELRAKLLARTMANIVNDCIVDAAKAAFESHEFSGVKAFTDCGMYCLVFDNRLVLRFKKCSDADRTSNVMTRQQAQIAAQEPFLKFDDWEAATWVEAAYHLTATKDAVDRIHITCHYLDHLLWFIPVFDSGSERKDGVLPFQETPPEPARPRKSKVRATNVRQPEDA